MEGSVDVIGSLTDEEREMMSRLPAGIALDESEYVARDEGDIMARRSDSAARKAAADEVEDEEPAEEEEEAEAVADGGGAREVEAVVAATDEERGRQRKDRLEGPDSAQRSEESGPSEAVPVSSLASSEAGAAAAAVAMAPSERVLSLPLFPPHIASTVRLLLPSCAPFAAAAARLHYSHAQTVRLLQSLAPSAAP